MSFIETERKQTEMKTDSKMKHEYQVRSFMSNVNRLDKRVHRQTHSEKFGTVELKKAACESLNGKRVFAVKRSPVLKSGSYSFAGLQKRLLAMG